MPSQRDRKKEPKGNPKRDPQRDPKFNRKSARVGMFEKPEKLQAIRLTATLVLIDGSRYSATIVPLKDVSATGAGLYSKMAISPQTLVRLSIEGVDHPPIDGKVVWCGTSIHDAKAPTTHPYRVGIEFTPQNDFERTALAQMFVQVSKLVESW